MSQVVLVVALLVSHWLPWHGCTPTSCATPTRVENVQNARSIDVHLIDGGVVAPASAARSSATSPQAIGDPPAQRRGREFLHHPVVVGTALALISGLIAGVLLPAATRSWQDRPRELALKRDLVTDVSEAATAALSRGNIFAYRSELEKTSKAERIQNLIREGSDWDVASSAIGSQLATYFGKTTLPRQWAAYQSAVSDYIEFTSHANEKYHPELGLIVHFKSVRYEDPEQEQLRKEAASTPEGSLPGEGSFGRIVGLSLLSYERDQIARRILAEDAAGFSHGFSIFGD